MQIHYEKDFLSWIQETLSSLNKYLQNYWQISVNEIFCKNSDFCAFFCFFLLSSGRYVYCNHQSKQLITKGCEHTSVRAAMLFMVPGREKHRSLLTRIPVWQKHQLYHQFWWWTKPPFVTQESISTISPVNCINRSIHVTKKHFLAQFTFLTQRRQQQRQQAPVGSILWQQPRANLQLITKCTHCC